MTRKQAISKAIEILSKDKENYETVIKLKEILVEMPLFFWTKESIIDSIEEYANEHNNTLPPIIELKNKNNLPSRTIIEKKFNVSSIDLFYKKYFSDFNSQNKSSSKYRHEPNNYFQNVFKENYTFIKDTLNVKYVNSKMYNKYKKKNTQHL